MRLKLLILMTALALAGCAGKTRTNNTQNTESSATESTIAADSTALAEEFRELGYEVGDPKLLATVDVSRYRQYGLTKIDAIDPFVVGSNEKIVLKDPETANDGLNGIRFEEWGDKEWLNNNYIRSVRLYLDAYVLGLVKDEGLDKHKAALKGKFCICSIEPLWAVVLGCILHLSMTQAFRYAFGCIALSMRTILLLLRATMCVALTSLTNLSASPLRR